MVNPRQQQKLTATAKAKPQRKQKAKPKAKASGSKATAKAKVKGKAKAKADPAPLPAAVPYIRHAFQEARVAVVQAHKESLKASEPTLTRAELQKQAQDAWMASDERRQRLNSLPPKELKRRKFH